MSASPNRTFWEWRQAFHWAATERDRQRGMLSHRAFLRTAQDRHLLFEYEREALGLNAGVAYGPLAGTHHAIDDISIMLGFGTIQIFAPSDGVEAAQIIRHALSHVGPVYVRWTVRSFPFFMDPGYRFQPGGSMSSSKGAI